ncbi:MAG: right-handed parallel beta-helix repeat-containing protein [Saprospiraceae bacterium]|nr:right-handed parallel beta-helix repeat-containing protein [Saprospiraceae bacterium]
MILSDKYRLQRRRQNNRLLAIAVLLLLAGSLLYVAVHTIRLLNASPNLVFCDAETVRGENFKGQGGLFSNGKTQSAERARSGSYSSKVPEGSGAQYGFGHDWKGATGGELFIASVWRFKNPGNEGRLVARAEGVFHFETDTPVQMDGQGWEKLEIRFHIPYGKPVDKVGVYVYGSGQTAIFFDDLKVEKTPAIPDSHFRPEKLQLQISDKAMATLREKREAALRSGVLENSEDGWVNANILDSTGRKTAVNLRLKGDRLEHLEGEKWSFRLRVKAPNAWKRMVSFSVHTPAARHFLHEWLLHRLWIKEDVLATRYDFIELILNGKSLGLYAYEEHFEKELPEFQHRREGPIVKLNEDAFWAGIERQLNHHGYTRFESAHTIMEKENADISTFNENKITGSPTLSKQYEQARELLYQFQFGLKRPADIFDLERIAKFYAISDVLSAYHGIIWHNQRFYYNPVTSRLEPIGFDGYDGPPARQYTFLGQGALNPASLDAKTAFAYLFQDEAFAAQYIRYLYQFTSSSYLNKFLDEVQAEWAPRLQWLQLEFPDYQPDLSKIAEQAAYLHSLILPFEEGSLKTFTQGISGGKKQVLAGNAHSLPVQITGYGYGAHQPAGTLNLMLPGQSPRHLLSRIQRDAGVSDPGSARFLYQYADKFQSIRHYDKLELPPAATHLFFKIPGVDSTFSAPISTWKRPENGTTAQHLFDKANPVSNAWWVVENKTIRFRPGAHQIATDVIIPAGFDVFMGEGVSLNLVKKARFISRSPVHLIGSEDAPVKIHSSDQSAQGFTVLQAGAPSVLKNVVFEDLNTLREDGWILTGAVNFYESEVRLYRCIFRRNHCEDALNIIRSHFNLEECQFINTFFDAFDSDFCKGEVLNCTFRDIGNDAMDFSGSVATIRNCRAIRCGDKGISTGEESDVTVLGATIENANIGAASKDFSTLFIRDITLKNCAQGFAAYQKKPEFGGAHIVVEQYKEEGVRRLYAISEGCSLQLGGQRILGEEK